MWNQELASQKKNAVSNQGKCTRMFSGQIDYNLSDMPELAALWKEPDVSRSSTGCVLLQSYDELWSLAEQGDMHNIHEYIKDLAEGIEAGEDNFYQTMIEKSQELDEPTFLFGKCVFNDLSKWMMIAIVAQCVGMYICMCK